MSFSNPAAALWALLAIPIVVLYIRKARMRRVPVATVMFWGQVFEEKTSKSMWQHLRHLLSLLLQLFFLAIVVSAITDPFFSSQVRDRRRVIVVLDTSASMRASYETGQTRLDAAKTKVEELIRSLKPNDNMAILVAGNQPKVICGLTSRHRTLLNHLESVSETDGPTVVPRALEIARRLLNKHVNGEIVVVTDGCFPEAGEIAKDKDVVWSPIGASTSNVGLTQFQVRRSLLDPIGFELLTEVSNFSTQPVHCKLDLLFNDDLLDVHSLELAAGEVWTRVFQKTSTAGGVLSSELRFEDHSAVDALTTDNAATAVLPQRQRLPVTLVTDGNWFLQRVLEANDVVDLTVTSETPTSAPDGGVLVLHRNVPQKVPLGKVFVVQPMSSTDLWATTGAVEQPLVARQDSNSDLLTHVRLDNVLMPEAQHLQPTTDHNTLVESVSGAPLYLHIPRPGGDVVVLSVDLEQGDLPLRTAFPIMLTNALSWYAGGKGELVESISTGETVQVKLPTSLQHVAEQNDGQLMLSLPNRPDKSVPADGDVALIGPLNQIGVWTLRGPKSQVTLEDGTASEPSLPIACNLMNAEESNLQSAPDIQPHKAVEASAVVGGRPIWFYLVLVGIGLISIEWYLHQRRWIS